MRRRTGFTLVEVMIGLALLAMLMSLAAYGVQMGVRSWTRAETVTADLDDIETVQGWLRRMIVRAVPAYATADPANPSILFAGEPETLMLVAPQPATQGNGPLAVQRLLMGPSRGAPGLFVRWQLNAPQGSPPPARDDLLLDHVAMLRFGYFGPGGPGQPAGWQDRWVNRDRLPDLIRISITRDRKGLRPWPDLIVATRVTSNATCLYDAASSGCRRVR
jgi:general secretion pathway protein J